MRVPVERAVMTTNDALQNARLRHPSARPIDREWLRLRCDRAALERATTWQLVEHQIGSLDEVLAAIGYGCARSSLAEVNLRRLVVIAGHDDLAARVVVRRLVPGALSVAARRRERGGGATFDDLLGALWIAIRTFDERRHPACLAAALLADADYLVFRRAARRTRRELVRDTFADQPSPHADADAADELAELIDSAARSGLADAADIALVRLLTTEPSTAHVAARLAVTERTIRNRRARLAAKLRSVAIVA